MARWTFCAAIAAWMLGAPPRPALAQRAEPLPKELEGVGITEQLDAQLPLDLEFVNDDGKTVRLGDFFKDGKPVILTLIYYRCPMLCGLVLQGTTQALKDLDWTPGKEFRVITLSFDPLETPTLAKLKKQNTLKEYGRRPQGEGWVFLTGKEANIRRLTDAIGFGYKWNDARQEYAHAAAIFVITPEGRVSRYLYGVQFEPKTVRLSLVEAAQGKIGSPMDQILLFCFHYDASEGQYTPAVRRIVSAGGTLSALAIGGLLGVLWQREWKRRKTGSPPAENPGAESQSPPPDSPGGAPRS